MKRIFLRNGSRKIRLRHVNVLLINTRITEQGILLIHFIEILENCIEPASCIETDGEKVFSGIFFGTDIDVCSWIISKSSSFIYLTYRNVPYRTWRKQIQWNQFVIRIRRSNRQSVQGSRTITVAQSAHNQLSCTGNRDTGYLLHAFLYITDAFHAHFFCSKVFNSYSGFLAFHAQRTFPFQVFTCNNGDFTQGLCIAFHLKVQHHIFAFSFYSPSLNICVSHVFHNQFILPTGNI